MQAEAAPTRYLNMTFVFFCAQSRASKAKCASCIYIWSSSSPRMLDIVFESHEWQMLHQAHSRACRPMLPLQAQAGPEQVSGCISRLMPRDSSSIWQPEVRSILPSKHCDVPPSRDPYSLHARVYPLHHSGVDIQYAIVALWMLHREPAVAYPLGIAGYQVVWAEGYGWYYSGRKGEGVGVYCQNEVAAAGNHQVSHNGNNQC
jgi:hypothetical protein